MKINYRQHAARMTVAVSLALFGAQPAFAMTLGSASSFAVLGASTVTNTGPSLIQGNLGVSPGTAVTGFGPGTVSGGSIHAGDAVAAAAHADAATAYAALVAMVSPPANDLTGRDLGGMTLVPGVYHFASSAQLTGVLTLDARGDSNALFVFQVGSTLVTAVNSKVVVINAGTACPGANVYWQVTSSATIGGGSIFAGNILALASVTLTANAAITGSVLAITAAVTMDTDKVSTCNSNNSGGGGRGGHGEKDDDDKDEKGHKHGDKDDREHHDNDKKDRG